MKPAAKEPTSFAPGVYSTSKIKPAIRSHLRAYHIRVLRPLTKSERSGIEEIVKRSKPEDRAIMEPYLIRMMETVFEIDVLGLDKAEAIGRVLSWIGDARTEKKWRIEVDGEGK